MKNSLSDFLYELAPPEVREYPAGGVIFQDGDPALALYTVESGGVRLVRFTSAGDRLTMYHSGPGDTIAEAALFADRYHCQAQADVASSIARHDKAVLFKALSADPQAMLRYCAVLSRQVRDLRMHLELRSIRAAQERVLHYLRLAADPATGLVKVPVSFKDLAMELGLAHETFYRVLSSLEQQGIIRKTTTSVTLLA